MANIIHHQMIGGITALLTDETKTQGVHALEDIRYTCIELFNRVARFLKVPSTIKVNIRASQSHLVSPTTER
jgi:alpha-D-ribose 1-methylphosphonate 5-phosphate C-P lyase